MIRLMKSPERKVKTALTVGFLFILLGSASQSDTSWLFSIAGLLCLMQAFYDRRKLGLK